ncbi:hypothetical protein R6Z07M_019084 [Ovis aries]
MARASEPVLLSSLPSLRPAAGPRYDLEQGPGSLRVETPVLVLHRAALCAGGLVHGRLVGDCGPLVRERGRGDLSSPPFLWPQLGSPAKRGWRCAWYLRSNLRAEATGPRAGGLGGVAATGLDARRHLTLSTASSLALGRLSLLEPGREAGNDDLGYVGGSAAPTPPPRPAQAEFSLSAVCAQVNLCRCPLLQEDLRDFPETLMDSRVVRLSAQQEGGRRRAGAALGRLLQGHLFQLWNKRPASSIHSRPRQSLWVLGDTSADNLSWVVHNGTSESETQPPGSAGLLLPAAPGLAPASALHFCGLAARESPSQPLGSTARRGDHPALTVGLSSGPSHRQPALRLSQGQSRPGGVQVT